MTGRRFALAVAFWALLGPGYANAAPSESEQQAHRSFERAEAHFKAGLFAEALAEYRDGYEQLPLPGFLINIAQCQRRLGDLAQARATYQKFILVAPDSPYVGEVKSLIAELDKVIEASEESPSGSEAAAGTGDASRQQAREVRAAEPPPKAPSAPGAAMAANNLVSVPATPAPQDEAKTRWWLWGSVGVAVVAASVVTLYALKSPGTTTLHDGSLGTLRR